MKHSIIFTNTDNKWDNALPLGNGCFGSMVYYEKNKMYMNMNHYEVYYNIRENVLPEDMLKAYNPYYADGYIHDRAVEIADINQPSGDEPYCHYGTVRTTEKETPESLKKAYDVVKVSYGVGKFSGSYPATGNLKYEFCDFLHDADQSLILYVEDAKCELTLKNDDKKITVDTVVARQDCIINHVCQSESGLMTSVSIEFPPYRDLEYPDITYKQLDDKTFAYTVKRLLSGKKPFEFSGIIRLVNAAGKLTQREYGADITLCNSSKEFYIMTSVFTDWKYKDPLDDGIAVCDEYEKNIEKMYEEQKKYWKEFFDRSSISIPDKFLEHVYYVNQYALDCCSGKDGIMRHHACGLNGLWDIRHPNLWGSMWYWDVNIQAAFAGVFSSNRLELAKVFSDGLLSYVELAKHQARDTHRASGIAGDYPYKFYYSCWPWCAQYLWFLYEYSLDKEYLKNDAFPVFLGLCEFYCDIFKYDKERGYYSVYPDISPEQGPLAHDTTITVASVKYLFKFTLEAAEILGEDLPILSKCREIMENMAPYPISDDGMYGVHLRDSHDAPDHMWIRHPSMLMPLFPIGEFNLDSDEETLQILSNTINFLEDRAEIGIFGGSWIAAAAARIGRGQTAYRLLYERGIDHMLRSNGLTAEETERFMNHCLLCRQPLYYPCMMEFTGEMLAALNEMLIQSHGGIIRVFPAIPDGDPEYYRSHIHGYAIPDYQHRFADYDAWKDVRFDKLLAKGTFEVTAQMRNSKVEFVLINSKCGGTAHITSPHISNDFCVYCEGREVDFSLENGIYSFETEAGKEYKIAKSADVNTEPYESAEYNTEVLSRETYTKRHIYLGENPETNYHKSLDGFVRDWYLGNARMENHNMYKFDFTDDAQKDYQKCLFIQTYVVQEPLLGCAGIETLGVDKLQFTDFQGYGFLDVEKVKLIKRNGPDLLRCDFVESTEDAEFIIEAPRGQYELLVVSGDSDEESLTCLDVINGRRAVGKALKKGQFQCKLLPLVNEEDEPIRLKVSTKEGFKWKINYIMLNAIKGY